MDVRRPGAAPDCPGNRFYKLTKEVRAMSDIKLTAMSKQGG